MEAVRSAVMRMIGLFEGAIHLGIEADWILCTLGPPGSTALIPVVDGRRNDVRAQATGTYSKVDVTR